MSGFLQMALLTCHTTFLLEMLLVEDGIGDDVAFTTGGRKSSTIVPRQTRVFDYQAEELSGQADKVIASVGSHGGVDLSDGLVSRGSLAGSVS